MPGTVHSHQHHLIILQQTMKTQVCNNKIVSYQKSVSIIGSHWKTQGCNNKIAVCQALFGFKKLGNQESF